MRSALYPGSFDPITCGHLNIITRVAALFEEVVVAVALSEGKTTLFSQEERVELARRSVAESGLRGVRVAAYDGLTTGAARDEGAGVILRGIRSFSDFEYESQLVSGYRKLAPEIETLFIMAEPDIAFISSTLIKEVARMGGDVSGFVPSPVEAALRKKLEEQES